MPYKVVRVGRALGEELLAPERAKLASVGAELTLHPFTGEPDLLRVAGDADAIINAGGRFPASTIAGLERCRVIVQGSVGYDAIDVDAATARGIMVANLFDYCIEEVADHALTLTLACARQLNNMQRVVRGGLWQRESDHLRRHVGAVQRLSTQTLGIVGFGNIGRLVARKSAGIGWRRIAADPYVDPALGRELGVEIVPLDQLLRESDYVTLHVFLNAQTRHLMDASRLALMKPTAYLINTCRGPVVDEAALVDALRDGRLAGAGLDVFEVEPLAPDSPLLTFDNVILTPHAAVYSQIALELNRTQPFDEVVRVLSGRFPRGLVNRALRAQLALADA